MFRTYFKRFFSQKYEKTQLNKRMYNFSVEFKTFDTSNMINIHKHLVKKHKALYKIFGLIKKMFTGLLTGLLNASNHVKCV